MPTTPNSPPQRTIPSTGTTDPERVLAPFAPISMQNVQDSQVRCLTVNDVRTLEADFEANGSSYRFAFLFDGPEALSAFVTKITTAHRVMADHDDLVRNALAYTPQHLVCDECGREDEDGDYVSIRALNGDKGLCFYHPACAAEYTWLPGQIIEGELPA